MLEGGQMLFAKVGRVGTNAPVALMPEMEKKSPYPAHLQLPVLLLYEIFIPSFQLTYHPVLLTQAWVCDLSVCVCVGQIGLSLIAGVPKQSLTGTRCRIAESSGN